MVSLNPLFHIAHCLHSTWTTTITQTCWVHWIRFFELILHWNKMVKLAALTLFRHNFICVRISIWIILVFSRRYNFWHIFCFVLLLQRDCFRGSTASGIGEFTFISFQKACLLLVVVNKEPEYCFRKQHSENSIQKTKNLNTSILNLKALGVLSIFLIRKRGIWKFCLV